MQSTPTLLPPQPTLTNNIGTNTPPRKHDSHASSTQTPTKRIRTHTHSHTANLTDSSGALIADLNRPGDLSLSLTHTQHTSFFSSFSSPFFSFFPPQISLSFSLSSCVTSNQLIPVSPSSIIFTRKSLCLICSTIKGDMDTGIQCRTPTVVSYTHSRAYTDDTCRQPEGGTRQ